MKIEAEWAEFEPGTLVSRKLHEIVIVSREDAETLIRKLSLPDVSEAFLVHSERPWRRNEIMGRMVPDHRFVVDVWRGFGYVEYGDHDHLVQMVGDPASPEVHTTNSDHFLAGTGVSLDVLVEVIDEFRRTATLPTVVGWRDAMGQD